MSDIDLVVRRCKRLERALRDEAGAEGRGLHALVTSVQGELPADLVRKIRFVATVRNKLIHESGVDRLDDRAGFVRACDQIERGLAEHRRAGARRFLLDRTFWIAVGGGALALLAGTAIMLYLLAGHAP